MLMIGRRRLGSKVRCELGVKEMSVGSWSAFGMALLGQLSVVREDTIESCCLLPRREVDVHVAITKYVFLRYFLRTQPHIHFSHYTQFLLLAPLLEEVVGTNLRVRVKNSV
jgi:hypothetical protein